MSRILEYIRKYDETLTIAELKKEPVEASIRMSVENTRNISAKEIKANPALKYFQK